MAHVNLRQDVSTINLNVEGCFTERQKLALTKVFKKGVVGKVQAADQSVASSTTLVSTDLVFNVRKGRKYRLHAVLLTNGTSATPGMKATATHSGQSSPTFTGNVAYTSASAIRVETMTTASATGAAVAFLQVEINGYFVPDANGTLAVQFAQAVSDAGACTVKAGSWATLFEA